jgi:hypothetical protein
LKKSRAFKIWEKIIKNIIIRTIINKITAEATATGAAALTP